MNLPPEHYIVNAIMQHLVNIIIVLGLGCTPLLIREIYRTVKIMREDAR